MTDYVAFTITASKILSQIILDASICIHDETSESVETIPIKALWDTGRFKTAITPALLVKLLARKPHFDSDVSLLKTDIYLPNRIRIAGIPVDPTLTVAKIDCAIGLDIISLGDSSLSSFDGKTLFSFRVPSIGGTDYVAIHDEYKVISSPKRKTVIVTGRDKMCPCGSGKKHKNCCAKLH